MYQFTNCSVSNIPTNSVAVTTGSCSQALLLSYANIVGLIAQECQGHTQQLCAKGQSEIRSSTGDSVLQYASSLVT